MEKVDLSKYRLRPEDLRWTCDPITFPFTCTDELEELQGFVGQDRAFAAIEFGLRMDRPGYNLFVVGPSGTGRAAAVRACIERILKEKKEAGLLPRSWTGATFSTSTILTAQGASLPPGGGKDLCPPS
jgi:hypothetical protein